MRRTIPINALRGDISSCIPSHYYKAGWHDFDPASKVPHIAILEMDMEEPRTIQGDISGREAVIQPLVPWTRPGGATAICPAITASSFEHNNVVREPIRIRQATARGYAECPAGGGFDAAYPGSKLRRGRVQDNGDVVCALTASADAHCVYEGMAACGLYDNQRGDFARKPMQGVARTLKADHHNAVLARYRIRKLTPTECFRLMGVSDPDIDKLKSARLTQTLKSGKVKEKPVPKTQLYKMAGNSIVVDVLYLIFKSMFIDEPPKARPIQKSLFDL